jgi:hypothetical protein
MIYIFNPLTLILINDCVQNFEFQGIYNIVVFLRYTDFWINCTSLKYSGPSYFTIKIHIAIQICDHCVVCPSSIWRFWLPFWYLQTLLGVHIFNLLIIFTVLFNYLSQKISSDKTILLVTYVQQAHYSCINTVADLFIETCNLLSIIYL